MRHLPISLDLRGKRVIVAGAGEAALAKLRVLLKTEAQISVFGRAPAPEMAYLAGAGRIRLLRREVCAGDLVDATLLYAAGEDAANDAHALDLARTAGVLANAVDDLEASDFITPALVDRDPVTIAIGTEGAAPALARLIKADVEARLSPNLGALARVAARFRRRVAELADPAARRRFWNVFFLEHGPTLDPAYSPERVEAELEALLTDAADAPPPAGVVHLIGAGPGDPELMTLKARRLLDQADVVVHDRLVPDEILDLARREARFVAVGKTPGGPSWRQEDINALIVAEAQGGATVARLKSGDPGVFGRLDEEIDALEAAGVAYAVVPGVTAATAAAASAGVSLTRRGRNAALSVLTGRDADGFAEHDWRGLSETGRTAAIYMGVGAAKFIQGRLLMHGADPATPVTVVENASRPDQTIVAADLASLADRIVMAGVAGPAVLFLGLAPRDAARSAAGALPVALGAH